MSQGRLPRRFGTNRRHQKPTPPYLINKNPPLARGGIILFRCGYCYSLASDRAAAVQDVASALGCHFLAKSMRFYAAGVRRLISSLCCHGSNPLLCRHLTTGFLGNQAFSRFYCIGVVKAKNPAAALPFFRQTLIFLQFYPLIRGFEAAT